MRQDICTSLALQSRRPSDPSTYGYAERSYIDVAKACDAWLKKHCPEPKKRFGEIRRSMPRLEFGNFEPTRAASSDRGGMHVPREKKPKWKRPSAKRYATDEERREALRAIVKAHWANLTPEERAARAKKGNQGRPKADGSRWMQPKYKEYKNEWQKKRRVTHPLTEEQLLERRKKAKEKYHANREQNRLKANERRQRAKAAKKAAQEASLQIG